MDQASSHGCGEKWVGARGVVAESLRAQQTDWMGRQEEVSLVAFCSVGTCFQSSYDVLSTSWRSDNGAGDGTSGNLKSDYIIPRLGQTTEGLKGFRDIILSTFLPPDQIHVPRAPKDGAWRDSRSPPGVRGVRQYTAPWLKAFAFPKPGHSSSLFDGLNVPKALAGKFSPPVVYLRKLSLREALCLRHKEVCSSLDDVSVLGFKDERSRGSRGL